MTTYRTDVCAPAASAPRVTNKVCVCRVCGAQWQMRSENGDDAKGCSFCDAPAEAVVIVSEAPDFSGATVYD